MDSNNNLKGTNNNNAKSIDNNTKKTSGNIANVKKVDNNNNTKEIYIATWKELIKTTQKEAIIAWKEARRPKNKIDDSFLK